MKKSDMTIGVNSSNFSKDRKMTGETQEVCSDKKKPKVSGNRRKQKVFRNRRKRKVSRNKIKLKVSRNRRNYRYIESVKK